MSYYIAIDFYYVQHFHSATSSSGNGVLNQLALPAPPVTNGPANSKIDLLSGDDLALVPVGPPQPASPVASDQNALALIDMFSDNTNNPSPATAPTGNPATQSSPFNPQLHQQPNSQAGEAGLQQSNGFAPQMGYSQFEQPSYGQGVSSPWSNQPAQQAQQLQQPHQPSYGIISEFKLQILTFETYVQQRESVSPLLLFLW